MEHSNNKAVRIFQEREGLSVALEKALRKELNCPEHHNALRFVGFSTWKRQKDGSWA